MTMVVRVTYAANPSLIPLLPALCYPTLLLSQCPRGNKLSVPCLLPPMLGPSCQPTAAGPQSLRDLPRPRATAPSRILCCTLDKSARDATPNHHCSPPRLLDSQCSLRSTTLHRHGEQPPYSPLTARKSLSVLDACQLPRRTWMQLVHGLIVTSLNLPRDPLTPPRPICLLPSASVVHKYRDTSIQDYPRENDVTPRMSFAPPTVARNCTSLPMPKRSFPTLSRISPAALITAPRVFDRPRMATSESRTRTQPETPPDPTLPSLIHHTPSKPCLQVGNLSRWLQAIYH